MSFLSHFTNSYIEETHPMYAPVERGNAGSEKKRGISDWIRYGLTALLIAVIALILWSQLSPRGAPAPPEQPPIEER